MKAKLTAIQERLKRACLAADRLSSEVLIIAVSKKQSADTVRQAYELGIRDFGENYAQEFFEKQNQLSDLSDIRWHFIGHLQTNKVKQVAPFVFALHSLNRVSLLESLVKQDNLKSPPPFVYLQLTVDPTDENKSSLPPDLEQEFCRLLSKAHKQGQVSWAGYMGVGPADTEPSRTLGLFTEWTRRAKSLWAEHHPEAETTKPQFSLGMSGDLEEAVMAGSTMIRVGTALFGAR
jgi:PLP dependent protein